jgi:glycosyltransferase involved in cell wall biosynthesis
MIQYALLKRKSTSGFLFRTIISKLSGCQSEKMRIAHVTAIFPPITLVDELLVKPGNVDDLAEKIQMLLDDPQQRQEMGDRGRAKMEEKHAGPKITSRLVSLRGGADQCDR